MAHFRVECQGNRGSTSRLGSKKSGADASVNGWNIGATTVISYDEELATDVVRVYTTSGSSYGQANQLLAEYHRDESGNMRLTKTDFPEVLI